MSITRRFGVAALAGAASVALMAVSGAPAFAGGGGYAFLEVTNFQIRDAGDTRQLNVEDDFSPPIAINNNGEVSANLQSVPGSDGNIGASAGDLDLDPACQGPSCPFPNNTFAEQGPGGQFARADQNLTGASVKPTAASADTSVTAQTVAEVVLNNDDLGGSTGSTGTITTFSFTTEQSKALRFEFDATQLMHAYLDADTSGNIEVSTRWSLTIEDENGDVVFEWTPDGDIDAGEDSDAFDLTTSRAVQLPGDESTVNRTGHFEILTSVLEAGTYTLSIEHITRVSANIAQLQVPEPGVLLLLGFGLLGVAYVIRRRDKLAA